MKILVVRHADAVAEAHGLPDEARYLSADGRETARKVAAALRQHGVHLDAMITSPLVRAVQTAEIFARELGFTGVIEALPALAPDGSTRRVAEELVERGVVVAAFGHEPSISKLAGILGGGARGEMKKAEAVLVDGSRTVWTLDPTTYQRK